MNDIALDPITNDLDIQGLDLFIMQGADVVRQQLLLKLSLWTGSWFLDTEFGTPYLTDILGKQITLGGAIAAIKTSILEVDDVQTIDEFSYTFDRAQRKLVVNFTVSTPFGLVRIST